MKRFFILLVSAAMMSVLTACGSVTTNQYEAEALVTYVWQVGYTKIGAGSDDRLPRIERFQSTSLVIRNGQQPDNAVTGPDDQGLWWPALPPRPTLDDMERRQQTSEKIGTPELIKDVKYSLTFDKDGQRLTLPTNYDVFRQAVKALPTQTPLELTLGVNNGSVQKAEPK
jgi:hypothetical protein